MNRVTFFCLLLTSVLTACAPDSRGPGDIAATPAERNGFRATPSGAETVAYLETLAAADPRIRIETFGTSGAGRPMHVVVVDADRGFTRASADAAGRAVVLVQNGIHAGEIDGKDACLMLLRDIARGGLQDIVDRVMLVVVPILNVDGHERVSPFNRPNQDGPADGMGFRTTVDGHDLNRDHLKLATPEMRAMIELFRTYRPDLHVDDHVTDGSDHDWVLTYSWIESPQIAPPVGAWLDAHMPGVVAATAAKHPIGPYVGLLDRDDPSAGFSSWVGRPWYATGYYPLRNRPSILVENHSYKPYRDRVLANRDFLENLLREIARDPAALRDAVRRADADVVEAGALDAPPTDVVLRWTVADPPDRVEFPVKDWSLEHSAALGVPIVRYDAGRTTPTEVPWLHRPVPERSIPRPRGYLVDPGWPAIESRLRDHGLDVSRLTADAEIDVERLRVADPAFASSTYQGLTRVDATVTVETAREVVPAGTLWVPASQPDFAVAVQLLEPDVPDSLFRWGLLSAVFERKEYIAPRVLEPLVRQMLQDPEIARSWKEALRDEALASNRWARWEWWYRRTPYWDDTVGLLPYRRVPGAVTFETEPFSIRTGR